MGEMLMEEGPGVGRSGSAPRAGHCRLPEASSWDRPHVGTCAPGTGSLAAPRDTLGTRGSPGEPVPAAGSPWGCAWGTSPWECWPVVGVEGTGGDILRVPQGHWSWGCSHDPRLATHGALGVPVHPIPVSQCPRPKPLVMALVAHLGSVLTHWRSLGTPPGRAASWGSLRS